MNYSTGKKILVASFAATVLLGLLSPIIPSNTRFMGFVSALIILLLNVLPTVTAFGFAVMYSDGKNKYNLALALAAVVPFVTCVLAYVLPYTIAGNFVYLTLSNCVYSILPLAWALKWKSRSPIFSIAFALIAVWLATSTMLLTLPAVENGMFISFSLYSSILVITSYVIDAVYIVSALLEKD